tara:strand:+ start:613 stop:1122 length:510 start_codon:yes stop_codon:yes gene_type:complete
MPILFADGTSFSGDSGKVLQIQTGTKTAASSYSTSTGNWSDIGLSVSITPTSASNDIYVIWYIGKIGCNDWSGATRLLRGSTVIGMGDADGNRPRIGTSFPRSVDANHWAGTSMNWIDSPSTTSSTTYKIQVNGHSNGTIYVNRGQGDGNDEDVYAARSASSISAMEVS